MTLSLPGEKHQAIAMECQEFLTKPTKSIKDWCAGGQFPQGSAQALHYRGNNEGGKIQALKQHWGDYSKEMIISNGRPYEQLRWWTKNTQKE